MYDKSNREYLDSPRADLLLFERALSALYGCDCKALAEKLVESFGSVSGVLSADARELETVPGVTRRAAALISLCTPVLRQALYRSDGAVDCELGLAVEACIEYIDRPYPFKMCVYADEFGAMLHAEKLDGFQDARIAVGCGARCNAERFAIVEYAPYYRAFKQALSPDIKSAICNLRKLGISFIDYILFDGRVYRSLVREMHEQAPFDLTTAKSVRYVCDENTLDRILCGDV